MILKVLDHKKNWHWIGNISSIEQIGPTDVKEIDPAEYMCTHLEPVGQLQGFTSYLVIVGDSAGARRLLGINGTKAFLCSDRDGETIDSIL